LRPRVAVLYYGVGNVFSVSVALKKAGADPLVVRDPGAVGSCDGVLLPGQGSWEAAAAAVQKLRGELERALDRGKPVLGVCLGMQILFEQSEEGGGEGLGFLKGRARKLPATVKVPHIGWNVVSPVSAQCPLLKGLEQGFYAYFAHSYYVEVQEPSVIAATTSYGVAFPSVVQKGVIFGVQFHPEKSGSPGLALLKNFVELCR